MVPLSDRIFLYKLYKNSVSELEYGFLKFINIDNGECTYVPVAYNLYMFHAWLTFSDGNNTEKYNEKHYDIVRLTDFTKLTVNGMYFFVVEEFQNIEPYKYIDNSDDKTIVNPELINKIIEFETKLLGKITEYLKTLNTGETIKSGYKNSASTGDIKLENIEGKELANLLPLLKNNIDKDFYSEFVSTFHLKQKDTPTPTPASTPAAPTPAPTTAPTTAPTPASTTTYNDKFIKSFQLRLLLIYIYYTDKFSELNKKPSDLKMIDFQYNNDTSITQYSLGNIDKLYDIDIFNKLGLFVLDENKFDKLKIDKDKIKDTNFYNKIHLDITLFIEIFRKLKEELGAAPAAALGAAPPYLKNFFDTNGLIKYVFDSKEYNVNLNSIYEPKEAQLEFEFNLTKKYFELLSLINKNINSNSIPALNNPS